MLTAQLEVDSITFSYNGFGGMSGMSGGSEIPERRARREKYCLTHCSDDDGALVCPNSVELWKNT